MPQSRPGAPPWVVIQHVEHEGPALIGEEARDRGLRLEVSQLLDPLPAIDEVGGLIVMGGPMGAGDVAEHPRLAGERRLLAEAVARDVPVLGVCLGAQLLALALGAPVSTGPAPELGFGAVELTAAGLVDPVLGAEGPGVPAFHWHGDTFGVPEGAVLLATTPAYPQVFRIGRSYAFQCHFEVSAELAAAWRPHLPPAVILTPGQQRRIERSGRRIIRRWFDLVLQPRQLRQPEQGSEPSLQP